jgi:hypothetical protein
VSAPTPVRASNGIWLVAEREIGSKLRSKAFLISTGILLVLALAGILFGRFREQEHRHHADRRDGGDRGRRLGHPERRGHHGRRPGRSREARAR